MQPNKNTFISQYCVVETIKTHKNKKISIVRNTKGSYYIAKKLLLNNAQARKQISIIKNLKHPNIVACHDVIQQREHVYLIEEYCEQGDLAFHIRRQIRKKKAYFMENVIAKWMLQLLLAIQYLHENKIIHRDIRPKNIFLTSEGNIKLGSFKSSKTLQNQGDLAITLIGSPYYMAPQCAQNTAYNQKVDIWAFGCVLYQTCSLLSIFNSKNIVQVSHRLMKNQSQQLPSAYSKQLNNIFQKCLYKKPYERPSAKDLLRTSYFLEAIQSLISNFNPINASRIPIKKYKVHMKNLKNAQNQKKGPESQKKSNNKNLMVLPKINEAQTERIHKKSSLEKIRQNSREIYRKNSRQNSKNKLKQKCIPHQIQVFKKKQDLVVRNSKSRQKTNNCSQQKSNNSRIKVDIISAKNKSHEKRQYRCSSKQKIQNIVAQKNDKVHLKIPRPQKTKTQRVQTQLDYQSPPKLQNKLMPPPLLPPPLLPPPLLPKVNKKNDRDFSDTLNSKQLTKQLQLFRSKDLNQKQKIDYMEESAQVKDRLDKIFADLNIKQQQQQQFSFDLEDENLARLTMKADDQPQLIKTYKTKLEQLIQDINYKYCPNMETIQQKTQQFDSNTFQSVHKS